MFLVFFNGILQPAGDFGRIEADPYSGWNRYLDGVQITLASPEQAPHSETIRIDVVGERFSFSENRWIPTRWSSIVEPYEWETDDAGRARCLVAPETQT